MEECDVVPDFSGLTRKVTDLTQETRRPSALSWKASKFTEVRNEQKAM